MIGLQSVILLVEDNSIDVILIERALQMSNLTYPLVVLKNGEEAIDYLSGQGAFADRGRYPLPALMLLDLKMPRKSGFEVLEWLKVQPALKRLRVIVLTSSKETIDINRAHDLGVNSYLVKPGNFDTLLDMVKTLNQYWMVLSEKPEIQ